MPHPVVMTEPARHFISEDALAHLATGGTPQQEEAWQALVDHDGDLEKAASSLRIDTVNLQIRAFPVASVFRTRRMVEQFVRAMRKKLEN